MYTAPTLNAVPTVNFFVPPPHLTTVTAASSIFSATFETLAASSVFVAITSHIIPITIGVIGVTAALIYLWKKVYGAPKESSAAPQPLAPAAEAQVAPAAAHAPTTPAPAPPKVSHKERLEIELKDKLPEITHLADNQRKTRATHDKLEYKDGKYFCHFDTDHEGYKAEVRYPVLGWMRGKEKNTYVVLEKPAGTTSIESPPATPRAEEKTEALNNQGRKFVRVRTSRKIHV